MNRLYSYLFVFTLLFSSCAEEGQPGLKGRFIGFVELIGIEGDFSGDHSGVIIQIQETGKTTRTEASGRFELSNLYSGAYDLILEKERYGINRRKVQFVGGEKPWISFFTLFELPDKDSISVEYSETDRILTLSSNAYDRLLFNLYFSNNPDMSPSNYLEMSTINFYGEETILIDNLIDPTQYSDKVYLLTYARNSQEPSIENAYQIGDLREIDLQ